MSGGFDFYGGTGPGPPETREEFICHPRPMVFEPDGEDAFDLIMGRKPVLPGYCLELTRERAETLLWETFRETGRSHIAKATVREKFGSYQTFPNYKSVTDILWIVFRSLVPNAGDQPGVRTILLQKLANYDVTEETRPPWGIIDYKFICRKIMREVGVNTYEDNSKPIYELLDKLRGKNPMTRWSSLLWQVFRELCPTPTKTCEAWSKWLDMTKDYAEEPHPDPIPLTRDVALDVCCNVLKEALVYPFRQDVDEALVRRLDPQGQNGLYWKTVMGDVVLQFCHTKERENAALKALTRRFYESHDPNQVVPKTKVQKPVGPELMTVDKAGPLCRWVVCDVGSPVSSSKVQDVLERYLRDSTNTLWITLLRYTIVDCCATMAQRETALEALYRLFDGRYVRNQMYVNPRASEMPLEQGAFGPRIYPGCAAVRNGTQKWLDTPPKEDSSRGKSQVTELANSIVLEALRRCRTLSSLDEWEKASLVDAFGKERPAVIERVLWDLAQHLVNAKQVPAAGLLHQLSTRTDLTPADMVYQAVKLTVEYLPKFTVDDLLNLTKGPSRRDIEAFLQGSVNPIPTAWKLAPRPADSSVTTPTVKFQQSVQVTYILLDEPKILRVKNLTEGSNFDQDMSVITITSTGVQSAGVVPSVAITTNPLVAAMQQRNRSKEMTATQLLNQTSDKELKRLVTALQLCLAKDSAWRTFAEFKGATSGASAEAHIQRAIKTGEPERFVIADIANYPGYLATEFLADLSSIHIKAVTMASEQIMAHLTAQERETQTKFEATGRLNGQLRAWLETNRLCSPDEVQERLDSLLAFGVQHLDDMALMTEKNFKNCGFTNLYPAKCVNALPTLMAHVSCSRSANK